MSAAAIFILIMAYLIFLFFKELLEGILYSVLEPKEKTVLRLIISLLQYAGIIGVIFASMDYLGINTTVMLAGFSAFSLAVSLGGKDLVADILAGIFIIFEDEFHVGDYIEVGGFSGIVQEIGVRSTKILGLGDNIKIIGNQDVKNVLNKSKMNTWYTLDFKIRTVQPLMEVEELLEKELPEIGRSIPEIISGPFYKGVWAIDYSTYTLSINCECKEIDSRIVQRSLNHELILLFEKYGWKFG
jgi:small conductance mechanosensitive channel